MTETEVEPSGAFFDIAAKLSLSLNGFTEEMRKQREQDVLKEQHRLANQPNYIPFTGSAFLNAASAGIVDFGTPQDGRVWTVRQLISAEGGQENNPVEGNTAMGTVTFAAGATASVSPPFFTRYVTGFDVTVSAATAGAPISTVTLSGVAGGPITWTIQQETTAGQTLSIRFPGKGLLPFGNPTLSINTTAGGGSGVLTIYGLQTGSPAQVNWYVGAVMPTITAGGVSNPVTSQWKWQHEVLPRIDNFTSDVIQVKAREHLFAIITSGIPNETIVCNGTVLDEPLKSARPIRIT
jgi:hypothetical protein